MRFLILAITLALSGVIGLGCASKKDTTKPLFVQKPTTDEVTPPPKWVQAVEMDSDKLCGVGVAGPCFDKFSPYPKKLSEERAVKNLAGVLGTQVQEAIIDKSTNNKTTITTRRHVHVDDVLIEKVAASVETEFWVDNGGLGPFAQKRFTYAQACMDSKKAANALGISPDAIAKIERNPVSPKKVPKWVKNYGKQKDGRICAVGFSLPTFHPSKSFEGVIEDIRAQLAKVIQTLVSSYYEELTSSRYQLYESMVVATTDAFAKGVVVTHFWYDKNGIGPQTQTRSTYGWGCVYPVEAMLKGLDQVQPKNEEEKQVIQQVRKRAAAAFDDLDAEIEKRESKTNVMSDPLSGGTAAP